LVLLNTRSRIWALGAREVTVAEFPAPFSPDFETDTSWIRNKIGLLVALVLLVAAGTAGWWMFLRDTSTPVATAQPQTTEAVSGTLLTTLSATGTAAASVSSRLTFGAAAKVTSVEVKIGDKVEAGQKLATLNTADLQRKLDSANVSLSTAQLRLDDLLQPATTSELSTAQASISAAQVQLANAEENLRKAQPGADTDAIATADAAVTSAEQALTTARNQNQSAWISLTSAQRTYCTTDNRLTQVCYETDLPLSQAKIDALIEEIRHPATSAVASAAQAMISASTSYENSVTGVANATRSLESAVEKRRELDAPPSAIEALQLDSAIQTARASLLSAQQRYDDLLKGADATELGQQREAVTSAQINRETAQANLDASVLLAPFAGTITAVGVAVGDNVTTATAAFTLTNTEAIRIDMNVQEADFVGLAAGQFGTATFDVLTGHTYVVRITSVNPSPSTNQGIVSYQVQAEVLGPAALEDQSTLEAAAQALALLSGQGLRGGVAPGGQTGAAPAGGGSAPAIQTARAGGQAPTGGAAPGSGPNARPTPGAGGFQPGGPAASGGISQAILDAPSPTPGMTANVTILKAVVEDALLVPNNAIRTTGTVKSVTVRKEDGTTEQRVVRTGLTDGTNTVVTQGLSAGEVVVVSSTTAAATGDVPTTGQFPGAVPGGGGAFGGGPPGGGANTNDPAGGVR